MSVISYPIPLYSNLPIQTEFYEPRKFNISGLTLGVTTVVTTAQDHNYVVGQIVRLLIPQPFGSYQLNERSGIVRAIPAADQVEVEINSTNASAFIATPYTASITGATQALQCVVTANNSFRSGQRIEITGVEGMTELNQSNLTIVNRTSTTFTLDVDSTSFTAYSTGGTATLLGAKRGIAQIVPVGGVLSGRIGTNGNQIEPTIPGSFINVSP